MFEIYTEKGRRAIFFARFEAGSFGSPSIETEHLLLGLLRENKRSPATFCAAILLWSRSAKKSKPEPPHATRSRQA